MRIGIYDPYLDTLGGGEKYMLTIAECLAPHHDVHIFWDNPTDIDKAQTRFSLDLSNVTITKNIFAGTRALSRYRQTRKYDVLFILSDGSLPFTNAKKTFVHFQFPVEWVKRSRINRLKLKKISGLFCNSQYTKKYIDKTFSCDSKVIYPPVTVENRSHNKENIILTVGRYAIPEQGDHDFKKQEVLLQVFKEMIDDGLTGWKFVVASGVRPEFAGRFEELKKTYASYPVEFVKNSDHNHLWDLYGKALIYWHASGYNEDLKAHPERAEHFGISTVEAMGAGAVPVVINAGGQAEIVEQKNTGFLWNTLDELKEQTLHLIHNQSTLNELSEQAQKSASKYSKMTFCEQINTLLES